MLLMDRAGLQTEAKRVEGEYRVEGKQRSDDGDGVAEGVVIVAVLTWIPAWM